MKSKYKLYFVALTLWLILISCIIGLFCVVSYADIPISIRTHDGKELPSLPDELSGKHFILFNSNGYYRILFYDIEEQPTFYMCYNHDNSLNYDSSLCSSQVLSYKLGNSNTCYVYENNSWVRKDYTTSSSVMTPPIHIVCSTFDIINKSDESKIFFKKNIDLLYKNGDELTTEETTTENIYNDNTDISIKGGIDKIVSVFTDNVIDILTTPPFNYFLGLLLFGCGIAIFIKLKNSI